jgi:hypothetical protein
LIGVLAGCFALVVFSLRHAPPNLENVKAARVGAVIVARRTAAAISMAALWPTIWNMLLGTCRRP